MYKPGQEVKLIGRTPKGISRVGCQGEIWIVIRQAEFKKAPALFLQSKDNFSCYRWVLLSNDEDFEIETQN